MSLTGFENINTDISEKLEAMSGDFIRSIQNYGINNPVKSDKIEAGLGISGVEVRTLVRYLRRLGYPIGSNSKGYFWIKDEKELSRAIRHLIERKDSLERTIREMSTIKFNLKSYEYQTKIF